MSRNRSWSAIARPTSRLPPLPASAAISSPAATSSISSRSLRARDEELPISIDLQDRIDCLLLKRPKTAGGGVLIGFRRRHDAGDCARDRGERQAEAKCCLHAGLAR